MSVTAVIIARMGSTRLPGKVLMDLGGRKKVLSWVVDAARMSPGIDRAIVATSTLPGDDLIATWCRIDGTPYYRGSESDVLARVAGAVRATDDTRIVVRLTADCPFLDREVIGAVVRLQKMTGCDYASNVSPRTWPDGLDVEAFTVEALFAAEAEATRPIDRECVTTWIARNRSRFPAQTLICPLPGLERERWVLDTDQDMQFCRIIADELYRPASYLDILAVLDRRPGLRDINRHHPTNERYHEAIADEPIVPRSYPRSQAQFARAHKVIPLAAQTFSKSHIQFPQPSPLFVSHGQGGVVWDIDGNEYVDLVSALLPNVLGYRDPDIDAAIRCQLAAGVSFSLATELEAQLAETLIRLIPCAEMVRFAKTGTEATTAAVRLARAHTGRDQVVICGGYHGWNDWSIAGTERDLGVPNILRSPMIRRLKPGQVPIIKDDVAAVIIEPECNRDQLELIRQACDRVGAVLIFDEVITGFRFDLGGAQKLYGVTPDLACFGKAMANGMPLAAVVGRADIMRRMEPPNPCVFVSGTFGGETLSLAAAIATIAKLEREHVIEHLWSKGAALRDGVRQRIEMRGLSNAIALTGEAPLIRLSFRDTQVADTFRREMIASGTLIIGSHNVCYAHSDGDIARVLKSYQHTLDVLRGEIV